MRARLPMRSRSEEKAGWEVAEAAYDGTDFVVTFEREGAR